jgi:alkanesulfonate monooxygenase SsuD/methylene tetrahydromethanopterin reductase-like flavin-dependent oxidoreductase (luciferase family)
LQEKGSGSTVPPQDRESSERSARHNARAPSGTAKRTPNEMFRREERPPVTDYGRPISFGFFPEPAAADIQQLVQRVRYADAAGLALIGIQDHPYQRRHLDALSLITYLTAQTQQVSFFPDVACLPLRPPAVLAQAAASIDLLGGGRFELGLGAGGFTGAIEAMGGPRREPRAAVDALEEAISVLRLAWSSERSVRFSGSHYTLAGLHPGPAPAHPISVWLGASGPRMLALTGRVADGWVPSSSWAGPERLGDLQGRIDDAAAAAGRQPSDIRRIYNINGAITRESTSFLKGPPNQWVEELSEVAIEHGIDTFVLWSSGDVDRTLRTFTEEIRPAVTATVNDQRASTASHPS